MDLSISMPHIFIFDPFFTTLNNISSDEIEKMNKLELEYKTKITEIGDDCNENSYLTFDNDVENLSEETTNSNSNSKSNIEIGEDFSLNELSEDNIIEINVEGKKYTITDEEAEILSLNDVKFLDRDHYYFEEVLELIRNFKYDISLIEKNCLNNHFSLHFLWHVKSCTGKFLLMIPNIGVNSTYLLIA